MSRPARRLLRATVAGIGVTVGALLLTVADPAAARPADSGGPSVAGPSVSGAASAPAWLRYDRPATYEVASEEVRVPMRDGVGMRCTLARPARAGVALPGPYPAIVTNFFAYRAFQQTAFKVQSDGFTTRGYATLSCSPRGSGGTPGTWAPFAAQESRDNYDLVEWAGKAPWSDGRVGQTGISYGGITTYKAAAAAPPHLKAVAPIVAYSDVYSEMVYPGGVRGMPLRWWPALTWGTSLPDAGPDGVAALPRYLSFEEQAQAHPLRDTYWRELAIDTEALDAGNVPVLGIGGWHDLFPAGMVANYLAAKDQSRLLMLPWAHGDFVPGLPDFAVVDHALLAWFDHHLMRLPGAPLPSAKVTSWELPRAQGKFVELRGWPASDLVQRVYLTTAGTLALEPGTPGHPSYKVNPFDNGCACVEHGVYSAPDDPYNDQRVADQARLHFDGRPLAGDAVIAGSPVAHLDVALSADDGNLVVRLEDVAPDGTSHVVTTGWLRASHRSGHAKTVTLIPGKTYSYDVPLWPTHWRLRAGHLLRVSVSSGDLAMIEPNAPAGTVTVVTGGTGGTSIDVPTGTTGR